MPPFKICNFLTLHSSNLSSVEEWEEDGVSKIIKTRKIITEKTYRTHRTVEKITSSAPGSPKLSPRSPLPPALPSHMASTLSLQNSFSRPESPYRTSSPFPLSRPQSPSMGSQRTLITSMKTTPSPASLKNPNTPVTKSVTTTVTSFADSNGDRITNTSGGSFLGRLTKKASQSSFGSSSSLASPPPLPTSPPPYFSTDNVHESTSSTLKSWQNTSQSPSRPSSTEWRSTISSTPLHRRVASPPPKFSDNVKTHQSSSKSFHESRLQSFLEPPAKSSSVQNISLLRESPLKPPSPSPFSNSSFSRSKTYSSSTSNLLNDSSPSSSNRYFNKPSTTSYNSTHSTSSLTRTGKDADRSNEAPPGGTLGRQGRYTDLATLRNSRDYSQDQSGSKSLFSSSSTTTTIKKYQRNTTTHYGEFYYRAASLINIPANIQSG